MDGETISLGRCPPYRVSGIPTYPTGSATRWGVRCAGRTNEKGAWRQAPL
ncbi:MAG: hypothetical protein RLZZ356_1784 [Verrucomicrobiota bacterium]|jgi:hypothetical protein